MSILVEFFGVPRLRAGVAQLSVLDGCESAELQDVLREICTVLPEFGRTCFEQDRLCASFVVSVNGEFFAAADNTTVRSDQPVLVLSADAGG